MRSFAAVLAFAASALAISVTAPTNATGWATSGQNTVSWSAVSTDPKNFTIVLVNKSVFPNYEQQLAALVDSSLGSVACNPPSTGWPTGQGYQVNIVADAQHLDTILAQSDQFTFHAASSVSGSSTVSVSNPTGAVTVSPTASGSSPSNSASDEPLPSTTDTATTTQNTNAASVSTAGASFFGLVALVGALLA